GADRAGPCGAILGARADHRPAAGLLPETPVAHPRAARRRPARAGRAGAEDLPACPRAPSLFDPLGSDGQPRGPGSGRPGRAFGARGQDPLRKGLGMIAWFWRAAWLLLPAAWLSHRFVHSETVTFFVSCAALIPLAKTMGDATEALAERMGHAAGSLLNATFGNAAELILAIAALRHGHLALVKGSI